MNLTRVSLDETARTCEAAARQRAENLATLGACRVLELCVGPSLRTLETFYRQAGLEVTGNDIDPRWAAYYPSGAWTIGDALSVSWESYDTVVFAPPLSRGCTGQRADALRVEEVRPSYTDFLTRLEREPQVRLAALVLPGRALSTREDRRATFGLMLRCYGEAELVALRDARGRIAKYHDIYLTRRTP